MVQAPPPLGPQPVPRPDVGVGADTASSRLFFVHRHVAGGGHPRRARGRRPAARPVAGRRRRSDDAPSATTDSPSPSASPAARAKVDGAFKFLERVGGSPVRWNPCDTISYAVNTDGATSSIEADPHEALARVTRATGIEFVPVGTTEETFLRAYQRMRYRVRSGRRS